VACGFLLRCIRFAFLALHSTDFFWLPFIIQNVIKLPRFFATGYALDFGSPSCNEFNNLSSGFHLEVGFYFLR